MAAVNLSRDVFFGHEFAAEVIEHGPGVTTPPIGTLVTSVPALRTPEGQVSLAYSNTFPGGFSEYILLSSELVNVVPDGVDPDHAALTELMAVADHAIAAADLSDVTAPALVLGCGPVGLATVISLRYAGVHEVIASDPSGRRRRLARQVGATQVFGALDQQSAETWTSASGSGWGVIFDAAGGQGVLAAAIERAAPAGHIIVLGVSTNLESISPAQGVLKELKISFVRGYTGDQFRRSLSLIASGDLDVGPLVTRRVGLTGIADSLEELRAADRQCKIIVDPRLP
jgi:2-desacetyl-2-hydroxyethyl bacteriochlorophyllide A dehydrogenase